MQKRRNDVKARTTLLLALPDEHQLRFSKYETAKELWEAILKTFCGNEAAKKTKKNQFKLQYDKGKAVKTSACWIWRPKQNTSEQGPNCNSRNPHNNIDDKGYWDSGCSRHMTGNISYLSEYEPYDGGYVSFDMEALVDESMLWHRRLGHLNFKTMNKLVRNNLVKGLPSKCFENDHSCVACLKGKQHKQSCKTKLVNSVSNPLHTLHMDLFGPTSVSSLNHKWYCLVATDDFSRCDNEGEFKNQEMNEFYTKKGIRREFSNARIPQQNRVAERRNKTLIEGARTMLADAKLPVTFWAEAVNTAWKFDTKGDGGYFVGYSLSSKAFRVFNKRTKKVEENLHVDFLENKIIEKGAGPHWLFDIDTLTNLMNYVPVVVAGTSSTNISGIKDVASQAVKKDVSYLRYIALLNWFHEAHMETFNDTIRNSDAQDDSQKEQDCNADVPESSGISNPTATLKVPSADHMEPAVSLIVEYDILTVSSPVPTICLDISLESLSDSRLISKAVFSQKETPSLGNALTLSNRFEDTFGDTTNTVTLNEVEANLSNMETSIPVSPTPTFRIYKDHPKSQIIGPVDTPVQTRHKSKDIEEQSFIATIHQKTNLELLQFCLFSCFLSQEEPKKIFDALKEPSWVEAIQEELLQFKIQNVWVLVDCSKGEEGIDYEEVFAPVARIEAIRLFLAYASFIGFIVYQMDVKSAFLYGTIDEEVYVMQPPRFQDLEFPEKVYKVEKTMYGLHQAPRAWYDTLSKEFKALMHDKFQMSAMGELTFFLGLQVLQKKDGIFLSQDKYIGDILKKFGYLDVRHQVTPKECHLHDVKRIFRYLKGHPKLGLWYPKESPFDLVAYSDNDYGGATQDRKTVPLFASMIVTQCEGSANPTEPHHTPSPQEHHSPQHDSPPLSHQTITPELIPHDLQAPTETLTPRRLTKRAIRIAQSKALSPDADEPVSLSRDDRQGKAFPTVSSLDAGQDKENIAKTSTMPYDSSPRVPSLDADEGSSSQVFRGQRKQTWRVVSRGCFNHRGIIDIGEELGANKSTEKGSNDTEDLLNVLSSIEATNILSSGGAAASVSPADVLPTAGFPTVSANFTTASVVTPYIRRSRGITIGSLQPMRIPIVAREMEEEFARENKRLSEKVARDYEIAKIHAEEELKMMIEGLNRSNEVIAKHLSEYEQAEADLSVGEKIELIRMTLEQIKEKFIPVWKQWEDFVPMYSKEESERVKRPGLKLDQVSSKRVKISHTSGSEPLQEQQFKGSKGVSEEELKGMMQLVPLEEVYIEALQVKHPIIDWEIHSEGKREYWKIIRLGDSEDHLWTYHQAFMHDPLDCKLYDTCGVHHVSTKNQEIFMLVEKDYPLRKGLATVMIILDEELFEASSPGLILYMTPWPIKGVLRAFVDEFVGVDAVSAVVVDEVGV
nr:hypothetical protein [Tanacetum cinerariifolium]